MVGWVWSLVRWRDFVPVYSGSVNEHLLAEGLVVAEEAACPTPKLLGLVNDYSSAMNRQDQSLLSMPPSGLLVLVLVMSHRWIHLRKVERGGRLCFVAEY